MDGVILVESQGQIFIKVQGIRPLLNGTMRRSPSIVLVRASLILI